MPQRLNGFLYHILCENGEAFEVYDDKFYKTGTELNLPDDMCMPDSGWVQWLCNNCTVDFWIRSRPCGMVQCPCCESMFEVPSDAIMLPFEGANYNDYKEALYEEGNLI